MNAWGTEEINTLTIVHRRTRCAGFTLTELLITLTVAAILTALAVPSYRSYIQSSRMASATNDLVAVLNTARSVAISTGQQVVFCASSDQATCSGTWNDGWILFTDCNANTTPDTTGTVCGNPPDRPEQLLSVGEGSTQGRDISNGAGNTNMRYLANGMTNSAADETFTVCVDDADEGRQVDVNPVGRVTTSTVACP
ncbi:MAG: GspH/FimT family pseudopilin [Gammaproteobacteria bacterium]|nr:GspH/FimT family pseudopilin [Gammaproteobacteria bacterium]